MMGNEKPEQEAGGSEEEKKLEGKKRLEEFFGDRIIASESDFQSKGKKTSGVTAGYVAVKQTDPDGLPFMIKRVIKINDGYDIRNNDFDALCFVNELVTSSLYKRTMYDRTPIIAGVEDDHRGSISFRSKFLHDFQTVSQFTSGQKDYEIGADFDRLRDVQGAEKLFANMLAWGESDMHAGNVGVMRVSDEAGGDILAFAKIDHGWSASQFFTNPGDLLENFAAAYAKCGYEGTVPLNIDKLKQVIDQIANVSDEEIATLVKSRTFQLEKMGFDIEDLNFLYWEDDREHLYPSQEAISSADRATFDSFEDLDAHYIEGFIQQMMVMREVSKRLDIISKIDYSSSPRAQKAWKNGGWLQVIKGEDPLVWAEQHGKTIAGLSPSDYAAGLDAVSAPEESEIDLPSTPHPS